MGTREDRLALYRDPRWQRIRLQVIERDEWTCRLCSDKNHTLHVHHLWYRGFHIAPWDYPIKALVTLCENCHEYETVRLPDVTADFVQMMKQAGATSDVFAALCSVLAGQWVCVGDVQKWDKLAVAFREALTAMESQCEP